MYAKTALRLALIALVPLTAVSSATAAEPKDSTATIVGWNVFGNKRNDPIDRAKAKRIARGMSWIDAEVLVMTEVKPR